MAQMGEFLLRQMEDFLPEGLCFDTPQGGGRGSANPTLPHSPKDKAKGRRQVV
jgi:hypothetical protein